MTKIENAKELLKEYKESLEDYKRFCQDIHEEGERGIVRHFETQIEALSTYIKTTNLISKIKDGIEQTGVLQDGSDSDYWKGGKEALEFILKELE